MKSPTYLVRQITAPLAFLLLLSACTALPPPPQAPSPSQTGPFPCGSLTGFPWENLRFDGGHLVERSHLSEAGSHTEWKPVQITRTAGGEVSGLKWESMTSVEPEGILSGLFSGGMASTRSQQFSVEWDNPRPTLEELNDCFDVADD